MRTLKKTLSLVLALAMVLSLCVSGVYAADAKVDYADYDTVTFNEAVDVMTAVGVFNGISGNFKPEDTLTRAMAAKIITYMLLGQEQADKLVATVAPYSDVPVTHWAAGSIAYCNNEGILNGVGDGNFKPEDTLTGMAFAKMLLCALGYDFTAEKLVGDSWAVNTAKLFYSNATGLSEGLGTISGTDTINREQAAQMALNAVKAPLVEYTGTSFVVGDTTVVVGGNGSSYVTTTLAKEQTISSRRLSNTGNGPNTDAVYTIEFGEKYMKNLRLTPDTDAFGRPSYDWTYHNELIGSYLDYSDLMETYTTGVKGNDLYELLGKTVVDKITNGRIELDVYIDGNQRRITAGDNSNDYFDVSAINRNNKANVGTTGNGVLTQVFYDTDVDSTVIEGKVTIAIINTYLAIVEGDYNSQRDTVNLYVYDIIDATNKEYIKVTDNSKNGTGATGDTELMSITSEDFAIAADMVDKEVYLVNVADGEIQIVGTPEVLGSVNIDAFKTGSHVVSGGTTYNYASTVDYDDEVLDAYTGQGTTNLKDILYNIYLDDYGYMIGVDIVDPATNYLFITGAESSLSNLTTGTLKAAAIFLDGTMKTIDINVEKSDAVENNLTKSAALINKWYTYTVSSNDVYTVKNITDAHGVADVTDMFDATGGNIAQMASSLRDEADVNTATYKIDTKHTSLPGRKGATGDYNKVYGNDETVYLNVDVKTIKNKDNSAPVAIINKVLDVVTGIGNASFTSRALAGAASRADDNATDASAKGTVGTGHTDGQSLMDTSFGVFTLYKKSGYVIAAVVVGEDEAASTNLVYAHTKNLELEEYNESTGLWTWSRKVILNGEEVTITEVNDSGVSELVKMSQYNWYKVGYNAKGEVVRVQEVNKDNPLREATLGDATPSNADYVTKIELLPDAINGTKDTILYHQHFPGEAGTPSLKGNTFYTTTTDNTGFRVSDSVKVVFLQTLKNEDNVIKYTGARYLESVVKELLTHGENTKSNCTSCAGVASRHDYWVSAIVEKGIATTVIIRDVHGTGNSGNNPTGQASGAFASVQLAADGTVTLIGKDGMTVTGNNSTYTYTLYMRGDKQEDYRPVQEGTVTFSSGVAASSNPSITSAMTSKTNSAFQIEVNGVVSNLVLIP